MDKRYKKTNEAIQRAYFGMLMNGEKKITIAGICRRANIDRKTFYLHFETIDEIVEQFCAEKVEECMRLFEKNGLFDRPFDIRLAFEALNELVNNDKELYVFMAQGTGYEDFWNRIVAFIADASAKILRNYTCVDEKELQFALMYFSLGSVALYREHLCGRIAFDMDEFANELGKIAWGGLKEIIKPELLEKNR